MPPCGVYAADDGSPEVVWADVWVIADRSTTGTEYDSASVTWVLGPGQIMTPLYDPFKEVAITNYANSQTHTTGALTNEAAARAWFLGVTKTYRDAIAAEIASRTTPQP